MNNPKNHLRDPMKVARGLGSAKTGTGHFIVQRVTAIALVVLGLYVVGLLVCGAFADYETARATVASPVHAVLLIAFLVSMFWHGQLGLQVVIEDYVHTPILAATIQILIRFVCALAAIASVLAVLRIALGA